MTEREQGPSYICYLPGYKENLVVEKATRYFSYFHHVPFERFATGFTRAETDSIMSVPPVYVIKVSAINHPDKTVRILPIRNADGTRDPDRAIALINRESTPVIIRYFDLDPVLKEKGYFSGKKPF